MLIQDSPHGAVLTPLADEDILCVVTSLMPIYDGVILCPTCGAIVPTDSKGSIAIPDAHTIRVTTRPRVRASLSHP